MKAQTRKDYRAAWQSHVNQIGQLCLAADTSKEEYETLMEQLDSLVTRATNRQDLPEGK